MEEQAKKDTNCQDSHTRLSGEVVDLKMDEKYCGGDKTKDEVSHCSTAELKPTGTGKEADESETILNAPSSGISTKNISCSTEACTGSSISLPTNELATGGVLPETINPSESVDGEPVISSSRDENNTKVQAYVVKNPATAVVDPTPPHDLRLEHSGPINIVQAPGSDEESAINTSSPPLTDAAEPQLEGFTLGPELLVLSAGATNFDHSSVTSPEPASSHTPGSNVSAGAIDTLTTSDQAENRRICRRKIVIQLGWKHQPRPGRHPIPNSSRVRASALFTKEYAITNTEDPSTKDQDYHGSDGTREEGKCSTDLDSTFLTKMSVLTVYLSVDAPAPVVTLTTNSGVLENANTRMNKRVIDDEEVLGQASKRRKCQHITIEESADTKVTLDPLNSVIAVVNASEPIEERSEAHTEAAEGFPPGTVSYGEGDYQEPPHSSDQTNADAIEPQPEPPVLAPVALEVREPESIATISASVSDLGPDPNTGPVPSHTPGNVLVDGQTRVSTAISQSKNRRICRRKLTIRRGWKHQPRPKQRLIPKPTHSTAPAPVAEEDVGHFEGTLVWTLGEDLELVAEQPLVAVHGEINDESVGAGEPVPVVGEPAANLEVTPPLSSLAPVSAVVPEVDTLMNSPVLAPGESANIGMSLPELSPIPQPFIGLFPQPDTFEVQGPATRDVEMAPPPRGSAFSRWVPLQPYDPSNCRSYYKARAHVTALKKWIRPSFLPLGIPIPPVPDWTNPRRASAFQNIAPLQARDLTSEASYYKNRAWMTALRKHCRKCFPGYEMLWFMPPVVIPTVPSSWAHTPAATV
ncbi:hypothetical protein FRC12_014721 [Ceratobasidium sp. 428]|nr:hypothetical protein FRC12_014721 [Ceratobasidium sp. 428]